LLPFGVEGIFRSRTTLALSWALKRRGVPVTSGPTCRCLLCRVEKQLAVELVSSIAAYDAIRSSSANGLRSFASPSDLLSHLKATQAGPASDELFRDLLLARSDAPDYVEALLIVAFVPVLHGTVRRIAKQQTRLARIDIAQQALTAFLEVLHSPQLSKRQSHFAYAIARAVKRQLFEWAGREGSADRARRQEPDSILLDLPEEESLERHAALRHFLHGCIKKGSLSDSELDLLIQFKLDGNSGDEIADSKSITPNAVRQRMKRLLVKLRRLARTPAQTPGE